MQRLLPLHIEVGLLQTPAPVEPAQQVVPRSPQVTQVPPLHRVCEAVHTPVLGFEPQQGRPGPPQAPQAPLLQIPPPRPTQLPPGAMQMLLTQQPPPEHWFPSQQAVPGKPQVAEPPLPPCAPPPVPPSPMPPLPSAVLPAPPSPAKPPAPPFPGCTGASFPAALPSFVDASILLEPPQPVPTKTATTEPITIRRLLNIRGFSFECYALARTIADLATAARAYCLETWGPPSPPFWGVTRVTRGSWPPVQRIRGHHSEEDAKWKRRRIAASNMSNSASGRTWSALISTRLAAALRVGRGLHPMASPRRHHPPDGRPNVPRGFDAATRAAEPDRRWPLASQTSHSAEGQEHEPLC